MKRILFINTTFSYRLTPEFLTGEGFRVDTAHDPTTGLQLLAEGEYDLIILQERPRNESWQLCERIRRLSGIPLIVINLHADTDNCVRTITAGADFFMRKPFGPSEVLARINALLNRTSRRQAVTVN